MKAAKRQLIGGILLFASAAAALLIANSPLAVAYHHLAEIEAIKGAAIFLFFLSIGIELRHEITHGSLSKPKLAVVPIFAAIGGMALPVIIYSLVNLGSDSAGGWGVPMSTDIAFALGVLAIAGRWLPKAVRTYVMTVAVVDDSLTILMIAIFFASSFHFLSLVSLAGVLVGLFLPAGDRVARVLEPTVAYIALPVFAFLSAGVSFGSLNLNGGASSAILGGVILAMVIGKPLGVLGTTWLVTKSKLGKLPESVTWPRLLRVGLVFGMCFTVAMLMSELSFGANPTYHSVANVSVLIATCTMAILSSLALTLRKKHLHD